VIGEDAFGKDNEEDYYYEDNSYEYESIYDDPYFYPSLDLALQSELYVWSGLDLD